MKKYRDLSKEEKYVIEQKGTEIPFSGEYWNFKGRGVYECRKCGTPLYRSEDKFDSHCGWPSFDDEIKGAVKRVPDADGRRTEIICANCGAHLGHVFIGEELTPKNTRHCVNSIAMIFRADSIIENNENVAIFAGGCFWGVEYWFKNIPGVISLEVGYTGGSTKNPSYRDVCDGGTGHAEALKIVFDPKTISYRELAMRFFEIHDPEQIDRQGPDIGKQYRSAIYYTNQSQKFIAEKLIDELKAKGIKAATHIEAAKEFYKAEEYHQDYYGKKGDKPYCHFYIKKF
jgi:peptide methionine sulfoxide reductase msrA/msrB